jgi:hypothetical protein
VTATTKINLSFLRIPIYSFLYRSNETWCEGRLVHVKTNVIEDGAERTVSAAASDLISGHGNGDQETAFATNHWNPRVLEASLLFNSISGNFNRVTFTEVGREALSYDGAELLTTRYRTSGDLEVELWYDDLGRWVKLAFRDKIGARVEFVCRNCGDSEALTTAESVDVEIMP